jgi:glutathione synthase/RimK-type ligase-like ATP-grasp enzyme
VVLVVSHAADEHAAAVLRAIEDRRHPAVLVDTARFPANAALTQRFGAGPPRYELALDGRRIDLGECHAGWWRRPQPFTLHSGIAADVASFAYTECHEAVAGLWAALGLRWVNQPERDEVAHHKPYQLAVAAEVGLAIPRTLISNDPDAVRAFATEVAPSAVIFKTFLATEAHWRETRLLRSSDLAWLERLPLAPVIFQAFVPATDDLRVTIVGDRIFATAIRAAEGGYALDYRLDLAGAAFQPTALAAETEAKLRTLMSRLGLAYGAVDLRRTPDGGEVFLEINPAGEWRFVEERTDQPITDAMADLLVELDAAQ